MISIEPSADLEQKFAAVQDAAPKAMKEISAYLLSFTKSVFTTEGEALFGRWQDIADTTKKIKISKGRWPRLILTDTYQMEQSIQAFSSNTEAGAATNKVYAPLMQFGAKDEEVNVPEHSATRNGKTYTVRAYTYKANIPRRPFLGFNDKTAEKILDIVKKHI